MKGYDFIRDLLERRETGYWRKAMPKKPIETVATLIEQLIESFAVEVAARVEKKVKERLATEKKPARKPRP